MTLDERIAKIEERNKRVEIDKAWETSFTRKICIAACTYITIALYLKFVIGINPWINAIVPTVGFLLSTLTLSWFKTLWVKYFSRQ